MPGWLLALRKTFHRRTVRKKNVRPAIVVVVEYNTAVPGGFDYEFLLGIAAVEVLHGNSSTLRNVFEMDSARLHSACSSRLRGFGRLSRPQARQVRGNHRGRNQKQKSRPVHAGPLQFGKKRSRARLR